MQRPSGRQARPERQEPRALGARRPVLSARRRTQGRLERQEDPSLAPGLSGGRLGRQEARLEAVLGARRPVGGCLESQQARPEAV